MIRRVVGDNFFLISQIAHARLAAEIAARIGNSTFGAPLPRATTLAAVRLHDAGWPAHDDLPTINANGEPMDVFEMPLEAALPIWAASTDAAVIADPYAGLLVSLHGLALAGRHVISPPNLAKTFALIKFQHREIEIQESLRKRLGLATDQSLTRGLAPPGRSAEEDLLLFNFEQLEFADQLSLNLCFDEARIPKFPRLFARSGCAACSIDFRRTERGFVVEPWVFDVAELTLEVEGRRVARTKYGSEGEFRQVFSSARSEIVGIHLYQGAVGIG